jgi:hypothetical protein
MGVVGRVGADLLRLLIAAVVVGEEEEEIRTVVRGGIETDVACLAWAWLLGVGFLPKFDVPSAGGGTQKGSGAEAVCLE